MSLAMLNQTYALKAFPPPILHTAGVTPLSTTPHVLAALAAYLVIIFSIQHSMKGREPFKLTTLVQAHNAVLTLGSGALLVLAVQEVAPIWFQHGFFYSVCHVDAWTPRLEFYYMINYYMKYFELADTCILAFKKKPLAFLHVFHHSATAFLCYIHLEGRTSFSWFAMVINLTVHILMYYYYFATAGGAKLWWKKYLTTMQITQFIVDLAVGTFCIYQHFAYQYYPDTLPHIGDCAGSERSAAFSFLLVASYLGLFIDFYFATYKSGRSALKGKKET